MERGRQRANQLDASNRDDAINIRNWPVFGLFQPDGIATYCYRGRPLIVTENEGDARDYDGFGEEERVQNLTLDPAAFPNADELQDEANLGRLNVTTTLGEGEDGEFEALYSFGARSFSIFAPDGCLVFDSGDAFEQITAAQLPDDFNSNNDEKDSFDSRSDDKGPEPEGLTVAKILGWQLAFIGLERIGGVMVWDISDPTSPLFCDYINTRDFGVEDVEENLAAAGDLGPEGIHVIPRSASPTGAGSAGGQQRGQRDGHALRDRGRPAQPVPRVHGSVTSGDGWCRV